jgi:hypothetical protein
VVGLGLGTGTTHARAKKKKLFAPERDFKLSKKRVKRRFKTTYIHRSGRSVATRVRFLRRVDARRNREKNCIGVNPLCGATI